MSSWGQSGETILEEAQRIIHGARNEDYGHPLDNHGLTAALWGAYLGRTVTPEDVCFLNILQKVSRVAFGRLTRDTLVDVAGYSANVEMIHVERGRRAG